MQTPASLLKLTTLDRVLIRQGILEARWYGAWDDWAYFLNDEADIRLNVANTIGHTRTYTWDQVESIEKREPITVQALTEKSFLQYVSTDGSRRSAYDPEYGNAEVLMSHENLRGHLARFHIRYTDSKEFGSADGVIIHSHDMRRLLSTANRGVMPVYTFKRGRGVEAKGQAGLDGRRAKKIVTQFFAATLAGKRAGTEHDVQA